MSRIPVIPKKEKHVHKFKMARYKTGTKYFFCASDCSFKIDRKLALGKKSICWRCNQSFEMNKYSISLNEPHCPDCHHSKVAKSNLSENNHEPVSVDQILLQIDPNKFDRRFEVPGRRDIDKENVIPVASEITLSLRDRLSQSVSSTNQAHIQPSSIMDEIDSEDIIEDEL